MHDNRGKGGLCTDGIDIETKKAVWWCYVEDNNCPGVTQHYNSQTEEIVYGKRWDRKKECEFAERKARSNKQINKKKFKLISMSGILSRKLHLFSTEQSGRHFLFKENFNENGFLYSTTFRHRFLNSKFCDKMVYYPILT